MKGGSNALLFSYVLQWRTPKGGASITCTEENKTTGTESTMDIWYLRSHCMTS